MENALHWIRIALVVVGALCLAGAVYELRTAWRWVIGPAVGAVEAPLRVDTSVGFVEMKANTQPAFRQEIGETRFRGSTGYVAAATFQDGEGRLRIVRSEGLFAAPSTGRAVTVAYDPELPPPSQRPPYPETTPTDAEGALLTFDVLYGRACLYAFLAVPCAVLILGLRFFANRLGQGG